VIQVLPAIASEIISPAPRDIWRDVAQADPDTLVTQTPGWTDALCASPQWEDVSRVYVTPGNRLLVVPMVRRRGLPTRLGTAASMPTHWGFGGVLAPGGVTTDDVNVVLRESATRPFVRQMFRPNPLHAAQWNTGGTTRVARTAHVINLELGAEGVWKAFKSNARRAVRSSEKKGVTVEHDTRGALLPEFFGLLEISRKRWAMQLHEPAWLARRRNSAIDTLAKWQRISAHLDGGCHVWIARVDGAPAAGIIVLQGANAHYTRGAMDKALAGPSYANFALHWRAIQEACAAGARSYHMGESGTSESMARYKEQFGAQRVDYAELRIERMPLTRADTLLRSSVKRVIGFKDPE
jgi:hypothetical protein